VRHIEVRRESTTIYRCDFLDHKGKDQTVKGSTVESIVNAFKEILDLKELQGVPNKYKSVNKEITNPYQNFKSVPKRGDNKDDS